MKRNRKPLPLPQHEFGFTRQAFNLFGESGTNGDRLSREQAEAQHRRQLAEQAQTAFFNPPSSTLHPL